MRRLPQASVSCAGGKPQYESRFEPAAAKAMAVPRAAGGELATQAARAKKGGRPDIRPAGPSFAAFGPYSSCLMRSSYTCSGVVQDSRESRNSAALSLAEKNDSVCR